MLWEKPSYTTYFDFRTICSLDQKLGQKQILSGFRTVVVAQVVERFRNPLDLATADFSEMWPILGVFLEK